MKLTLDDYVAGVLENNRAVLARAITLIESNSKAHRETAGQVLQKLLPHTGKAIRIGVTGVPGVGKSSFIETLGIYLLEQNLRVAVLAVDPSSTITGGSILGDKTRMQQLGRDSRCFIRPSPSGCTLGGVARKTRETMLLCEAAGFEVVLIETVGVGQSETAVRSMVDFFLLLMLAGAGDELQGIKKGIIENADAILINKADGDNKIPSRNAAQEYTNALHYLKGGSRNPHVGICSALSGEGIAKIWSVISDFQQKGLVAGWLNNLRNSRNLDWVHSMIAEHLDDLFYQHPEVAAHWKTIATDVKKGCLTPTRAASQLIELFHST